MIVHVALETRREDVDAAVAFWALLGFTPVDPPPSLAERAAWVQCAGGSQIHLLFADDPVAAPEGHVAVVARDYETTVARLRAAGFGAEPRTEHWGSPRTAVTAPGGHRVEVMDSAPVQPQA